ncbi:MAG: hypothetical protein A2X08_16350 [Bacteroidetes bacterium GWA2_32_17]|nr:MAG: hypothetical protein A2X08_16350 [Bacteroidetes bacterium GWA2_32_17]
MTNEYFENIYKTNYQNEYKRLDSMFDKLYQEARDKKYATELCLGIFSIQILFIKGSIFNKKIFNLLEHNYKLGGDWLSFLNGIPDLKTSYYKEEEFYFEKHPKKREIKIETKKLLGIIPYGIKGINIEEKSHNPYFISSSILDMTNNNEIVAQIAEFKANLDYTDFLVAKYKFLGGVITNETEKSISLSGSDKLIKLKKALENYEMDTFINVLISIFAGISYDIKAKEGYFHAFIQVILDLIGISVISEIETNIGRIDCVAMTSKFIYLFEFKLSDSKIALEQIIKKKYFQKYLADDRQIILVGIAFDSDEKNIKNCLHEIYNK